MWKTLTRWGFAQTLTVTATGRISEDMVVIMNRYWTDDGAARRNMCISMYNSSDGGLSTMYVDEQRDCCLS
ncbi:hypothetical protein BDY19DRAFT_979602 [Irpex rosettiformis]|uniref:Uncharacterized protein n=1 Tax=Irpex rosettiformis TaxID=378272 RepID=A0ACB8TMQ8_9APHY|nr:hypothetical protein BDY19DRAFT_979602 [Irpex rosettiformis]